MKINTINSQDATNKNDKDNLLNHQTIKKGAVDLIAQGYRKRGKTPEPETRNEAEVIRDLHKSGESLTPMQMMILGFADLTNKNEEEKQAQRQQVLQPQAQAEEVEVTNLLEQIEDLKAQLDVQAKGKDTINEGVE